MKAQIEIKFCVCELLVLLFRVHTTKINFTFQKETEKTKEK